MLALLQYSTVAKKFEASKLEPWQAADAKRLLDLWNRQPPEGRLSHAEFAARHDIGTQGNLAHYLHGRRPLNLETAGKFARGLGVQVSDISPTLAGELADIQSAQQTPVERPPRNTMPKVEPRHLALLQAYLSLPEETRFAVRMLIETLAGAQNPRMHAFMRELEQFNHKRDAKVKVR